MSAYLFILVSVFITVSANLALRWRAGEYAPAAAGDRWSYLWAMYTDPVVLGGLVAAVFASVAYALALERLPLTVAYPMMALSFLLVPLGGRWLFQDPLSPWQLAGMALIVLGVTLTARG